MMYDCNVFLLGSSPESAIATIEITVNDVNDIVPALDRTEYSVAIPENLTPGDVVADVSNFTF